ncbi:MAG: hypothetical protein H5T36_03435 [Methanobacteriaceae archaeon]|nr:hypothetical protein [Methanobacteriaceae archaeon]
MDEEDLLFRMFSEEPGAYSPGFQEAISTSNTWEERMSAVYSTDTWGGEDPKSP